MLYPLTFRPIFKEKLWGGQKIHTVLGKDFAPLPNCGETWEVSGVMEGSSRANISIVANGPLAGQALDDLVKTHKADLVGKHVYDHFGDQFPLLVKFIDAADDLSIQVHPNDELARQRHQGSGRAAFGKTEMWYIMQADLGAELNSGFNRPVTKDEYVRAVETNTITNLLNIEKATAGDVFFLPAGRVHYIGKGLLLAEIQQTSDITYRIYDFDRVEAATGKKRQLHTEQAIDAIDYHHYNNYKTAYTPKLNQRINAVTSQYFVTNVLRYDEPATHDYASLDSFVILVCVAGSLTIKANYLSDTGSNLTLKMGECAVIPASTQPVTLVPNGEMTVLESYVP